MPQQIEVPGQGLVEFPDGMTDAQIVSAIQKLSKPAATPKNESFMDKVKGSVVGGAFMGVRDALDGGAQLLARGANAIGLAPDSEVARVDGIVKGANKEYDQRRRAAGRDGFDAARLGGGLASALLMPAATTTKGMIAAGAGYGFAQPVLDGDFAAEKIKQGAMGAAGGLAGALLGKAINPTVNPQAKVLLDNGVTPTAGQILGGAAQRTEDKLMSVPLLGDAIAGGRKRAVEDLNRAAHARALAPTGVKASELPVGREGVGYIKQALSAEYDKLLPSLVFKADDKFAADLQNLQSMAQNLAPTEAAKYEAILRTHLSKMTPQGGMAGETFKKVESQLSQDANKFARSTDAYQQELGSALKETLSTFRNALARSNPEKAAELAKLNEGFANYARIRNAAGRAGDQSGGFTPSQLAAAVSQEGKRGSKDAVATGKALMQDLSDAGLLLNSKYPDSGSIGRLLMAGGLGAGAMTNPAIPMAAGAAALPYTASGQKLAALLLAKRPAQAESVAELIKRLSPAVGPQLLANNGQ